MGDAMGDRGPPSSLAGLPPDARAEIDAMIAEGASNDAITSHLGAHGVPASRATVGRYAKQLRATLHGSRQTQVAMRGFVSRLDRLGNAQHARALVQLGQVVSFQAMTAAAESAKPPGPRDLYELARAIAWLTQACREAAELSPAWQPPPTAADREMETRFRAMLAGPGAAGEAPENGAPENGAPSGGAPADGAQAAPCPPYARELCRQLKERLRLGR